MGQKVNPISNRLGIIRGWDSNWFGGKNYGCLLYTSLLNFPNLKKLILGKNRYLLDENAANDAEHGQSKLYDEIASYDNMNWTALTFRCV